MTFEEILKQAVEPLVKKLEIMDKHISELNSNMEKLSSQQERPISQMEARQYLGISPAQFHEYEKCSAVKRVSDLGKPVYYKSELEGARERYKAIMKNRRNGKAA